MRLLFFALLTLPAMVWGQTNLIPNPGFENTTPTTFSYSNTYPYPDECCHNNNGNCPNGINRSGEQHDYWSTVANWSIPFHNINSVLFSVGSPDVYNTVSHTGQNSGLQRALDFQTDLCEYLVIAPTSPLTSGNIYFFEVWVRAENVTETVANGSFGLGLFQNHPKQPGTKPITQFGVANFFDTFEVTDSEWVKLTAFVPAFNTYNFIATGHFSGTSNLNYVLHTDDYGLYNLGSNGCPNQWLIEAETYSSTQMIYQASDKIWAGFDVGKANSEGNVVVAAGGVKDFKAGNEIRLAPGFEAHAGAEFHAYIAPCGDFKASGSNDRNRSAGNQEDGSSPFTLYESVEAMSQSEHRLGALVVGSEAANATEEGTVESNGRNPDGTEKDLNSSEIFIYPNPSNGEYQLQTDIAFESATIRDLSGRIVWNGGSVSPGVTTININFVSSGIYAIELKTENSSKIIQLVKQ